MPRESDFNDYGISGEACKPPSDITDSPLGVQVVELLAFGSLDFMLKNGMPLTREGFNQLVEASRQNGMQGKIAYAVQDWTQARMRGLLFGSSPTLFSGMPLTEIDLPSFMLRLQRLGGGEGNADEQWERASAVCSKQIGTDVLPILHAFRSGDCQRRLVLERLLEIVGSGDPQKKLQDFRAGVPVSQ